MRRAFVALALLTACSNAGSDLGLSPGAVNTIKVLVSLDRDASGSLTSADTVYAGARLVLKPSAGGQAITTQLTNPLGLAFFEGVPVGSYTVTVDPTSLGDTVSLAQTDPPVVLLSAGLDSGATVLAQLAYFAPSIRQARLLPAGRRILVRGLVLAGVGSFRDTTAHLQDTSVAIRLTRVSLRGDRSGNSPGDTVTVIGTTSTRAGQPTLDQAIITTLGNRPAPVPFPVSTAVAASAMNGVLDAALVQITGAVISDTGTVAPDFRVVASDGSGTLTILLDSEGGFNTSIFRPGRTVNARGVLVPTGTGQWQFKPRNSGDITAF